MISQTQERVRGVTYTDPSDDVHMLQDLEDLQFESRCRLTFGGCSPCVSIDVN